jgi:hypothetical protein
MSKYEGIGGVIQVFREFRLVALNGCGYAARTRLGIAEGEAGSVASNVNRCSRHSRPTIDVKKI